MSSSSLIYSFESKVFIKGRIVSICNVVIYLNIRNWIVKLGIIRNDISYIVIVWDDRYV